MGRVADTSATHQTSDPTPFQPPPPPPPPGYPNHHDNPLSSPPPPPPPSLPPTAYMVDNDRNISHPQLTPPYLLQSAPEYMPPSPPPPSNDAFMADNGQTINLPQFTHSYLPRSPELIPTIEHYPTQKPATIPLPQPPPANPPQQPPPAYPTQQVTTDHGGNYSNYNGQRQAVNYGGIPVSQSPAAMGTPNWYQPPGTTVAPGWQSGLLECFDDPDNAVMTFCFPCITFGQIAEIVDNGQTPCISSALSYILVTIFCGIPCIVSCSYRTKIRNRYGLTKSTAPDWLIHCFCELCALCQEYRELKARGMDPALGWQGNLSKNQEMNNATTMTNPPKNQTMIV